MGLRFRKSIKLIPGVKLNLNKNSTSITFGGKGFHHTVNSSGKQTTTVGLPGTGLSYTDISTSKKQNEVYNNYYNENSDSSICMGAIAFIIYFIIVALIYAAECFICNCFNLMPSDTAILVMGVVAFIIPILVPLIICLKPEKKTKVKPSEVYNNYYNKGGTELSIKTKPNTYYFDYNKKFLEDYDVIYTGEQPKEKMAGEITYNNKTSLVYFDDKTIKNGDRVIVCNKNKEPLRPYDSMVVRTIHNIRTVYADAEYYVCKPKEVKICTITIDYSDWDYICNDSTIKNGDNVMVLDGKAQGTIRKARDVRMELESNLPYALHSMKHVIKTTAQESNTYINEIEEFF